MEQQMFFYLMDFKELSTNKNYTIIKFHLKTIQLIIITNTDIYEIYLFYTSK